MTADDHQPTLFDVWPCPACNATGQKPNRETGYPDWCRTCEGTGQVQYDPADKTEIPFG